MNPRSAILTIAIPTYNRATKLKAQIEQLLPQLGSEVRLCIYDNASPDHTRDVVEGFDSQDIFYFRASSNCGGERNFFRCLEECSTEWLWMLSDDDPVLPCAVADLLKILPQQSCDYISTTVPAWNYPAYQANTIVSDIGSLFSNTFFGGLLWISSGVYKVASFRPLFRLYNTSMSTWTPHVLVVLSLLESRNGKVLLSPVRLIDAPPDTPTWSTLDCLVRMSQAPDYLVDPANQRILANRLILEWHYGSLMTGLREISTSAEIKKWRRIRKQAYANLKAYHPQSIWNYAARNCLRRGYRKQSLDMIKIALMVDLLGLCPVLLFPALKKLLPLSSRARDEYKQREIS